MFTLKDKTNYNYFLIKETFSDVGGAEHCRFKESIDDDDSSLAVLLSDDGKPVGYCGYYTCVEEDYNEPEKTFLNFCIYHVFLRKEYQNKKLSNNFSNLIIEELSKLKNTNIYVKYYLDSSSYISPRGKCFGNKIVKKLEELEMLRFE